MKKRLRRSTLTVRKFDEKFTQEQFFLNARKLFETAAILFVQESCRRVPSLTGQAKAALINVAKSIGVDAGVDPFDPPISQYEHLQVPLWLWGNTPARGETMGGSKIQEYTKSSAWEITLDITAAHNGFEYFTYWDKAIWNSIPAARQSANLFIELNLGKLLTVRTTPNG